MERRIVILLGHPGAGKGTQSRAIMQKLGIPQVSTGDMLRDAIVRRTPYGVEARARMDAGELVSDSIVNGIVADRICLADCAKGFILDGYPRTVQQADTFREFLKPGDHVAVIEIRADATALTSRLVGRLMCSGCGEIFNIYSRIPQAERICDRCQGKLVQRSDDREDLILERFKSYHSETFPLVQYYESKGVYHQVDGLRPIGDVTKDILAIVEGEEAVTPLPKGRSQQFA